jgi:hypothetical protein
MLAAVSAALVSHGVDGLDIIDAELGRGSESVRGAELDRARVGEHVVVSVTSSARREREESTRRPPLVIHLDTMQADLGTKAATTQVDVLAAQYKVSRHVAHSHPREVTPETGLSLRTRQAHRMAHAHKHHQVRTLGLHTTERPNEPAGSQHTFLMRRRPFPKLSHKPSLVLRPLATRWRASS